MWAVYNGNIHDPESKCVAVAYFKSYLEAEKYLRLHCNMALWSIVGVEAFEKLIEERCELQAQGVVLRLVLEGLLAINQKVTIEFDDIEPAEYKARILEAEKALANTQTEFAERVDLLVKALQYYALCGDEANIVKSDERIESTDGITYKTTMYMNCLVAKKALTEWRRGK